MSRALRYSLTIALISAIFIFNVTANTAFCDFCDEFDDGMDNWTIETGDWYIDNGTLVGEWPASQANGNVGNIIINDTLQPDCDFTIETVGIVQTFGQVANGFHIILYNSFGNKYYAGFNPELNEIHIIAYVDLIPHDIYRDEDPSGIFNAEVGSVNHARLMKIADDYHLFINEHYITSFQDEFFGGQTNLGLQVYGTVKYERVCLSEDINSLYIDEHIANSNEIMVPIKLNCNMPVNGFNLPILFDNAKLTYKDYALSETACDGWTGNDTIFSQNQVVLGFIDPTGMNPITSGYDNAIIDLIFELKNPSDASCDFDLIIDTTLSADPSYHLAFSANTSPPFEFEPQIQFDTLSADNFIPGDVNGSGSVNIIDITTLICILYQDCTEEDIPCLDAADPNGDCYIQLLDITYLINYLYRGGPNPVSGCVVGGLPKISPAKLHGYVYTKYTDTKTFISISSPVDLMGIELELLSSYGKTVEITNKCDGPGLFFSQNEKSIKAGIVDPTGKALIPSGERVILEIDGEVTISHALASDETANAVYLEAMNGGESNLLPEQFTLSQNHPNPFNPVTNINFSLSDACNVSLEIYNIMGQKVETLINDLREAGEYSIEWDGSSYASGVYFYRLRAGEFTETRKMTLLK